MKINEIVINEGFWDTITKGFKKKQEPEVDPWRDPAEWEAEVERRKGPVADRVAAGQAEFDRQRAERIAAEKAKTAPPPPQPEPPPPPPEDAASPPPFKYGDPITLGKGKPIMPGDPNYDSIANSILNPKGKKAKPEQPKQQQQQNQQQQNFNSSFMGGFNAGFNGAFGGQPGMQQPPGAGQQQPPPPPPPGAGPGQQQPPPIPPSGGQGPQQPPPPPPGGGSAGGAGQQQTQQPPPPPQQVDPKEFKKAYQRAASMAHPDKHPNADEMTAKQYTDIMQQLNAAKGGTLEDYKTIQRLAQQLQQMQGKTEGISRARVNKLLETARRFAREIILINEAKARGGVPW